MSEELREKANAATPGPWVSYEFDLPPSVMPVPVAWVTGPEWRTHGKSTMLRPADAHYIAAASPDVILALLDERDRLLSENEGMRKALEFYANPLNYIDTPSWDGDPTCVTVDAIPVIRQEDGGSVCDCGDTARTVLIEDKTP